MQRVDTSTTNLIEHSEPPSPHAEIRELEKQLAASQKLVAQLRAQEKTDRQKIQALFDKAARAEIALEDEQENHTSTKTALVSANRTNGTLWGLNQKHIQECKDLRKKCKELEARLSTTIEVKAQTDQALPKEPSKPIEPQVQTVEPSLLESFLSLWRQQPSNTTPGIESKPGQTLQKTS